MSKVKIWCVIFIASLIFGSCSPAQKDVSLKKESLKTLYVLTDALYDRQISDPKDQNFGAIKCESCNVLHTRAAEAVYPFAVAYVHSKNDKYLKAAKSLGNWLIKQQLPDGEWRETPEEWSGTTTDQLLMMVMAHKLLKAKLSPTENEAWENSLRRAADYLCEVMSPDFASINYCATTTASLAMTNKYYPAERYLAKSKQLASQVLSKMDSDGFIKAEGDRVYGVKYGADVGYEIDMSLWGLAIYARITGDSIIEKAVEKSLKNHLYFVYPNGAIDGSWGIRSNKWTTYGSATADGCQILFSLFTEKDPRYRTAAIRNLGYLRTMIKDGLIGYGPNYWEIFDSPPCIYPTFVRSKNLAMTIEWGEEGAGPTPELPTDKSGWVHYFSTVHVALVRSQNFMTTITAYDYQDLKKTYKSKYMHRPAGGSISNLWIKDYGFLQLGGQTEYHRWEPMHFPEADSLICITPRIEFSDENGYFSNLYEFDGRMTVEASKDNAVAVITTFGELSDKKLLPGGVAYTLQHAIYDDAIEKRVLLRYHDGDRTVKIIEPIIMQENLVIRAIDEHAVQISNDKRSFIFEVLEGNVRITVGKDQANYWSVYPSVKAFPIELTVLKPENKFIQRIHYRIKITG